MWSCEALFYAFFKYSSTGNLLGISQDLSSGLIVLLVLYGLGFRVLIFHRNLMRIIKAATLAYYKSSNPKTPTVPL